MSLTPAPMKEITIDEFDTFLDMYQSDSRKSSIFVCYGSQQAQASIDEAVIPTEATFVRLSYFDHKTRSIYHYMHWTAIGPGPNGPNPAQWVVGNIQAHCFMLKVLGLPTVEAILTVETIRLAIASCNLLGEQKKIFSPGVGYVTTKPKG